MAEPTSASPLRLGVLLSGGGTTLENLLARLKDGRLRGAAIVQVISSRASVRGVQIARQAGLPLEIIRRADHRGIESFSSAVAHCLENAGVELVVMAGFLCLWRVPPRYRGRVLNIHPALLPAHGGPGMYGLHVHAAVIEAGEPESGCTVHLADDEYDHGPIVAQRRVAVRKDDAPETLAARVAEVERELYPQVIQNIVDSGWGWLDAFTAGSGRRAIAGK